MSAPVEGGHWRLPTDQKGLSRGILDVFCPCPPFPMVRLMPFAKVGVLNAGGLFDQKHDPVSPFQASLLLLTRRTTLEESLSHLSVAPSGH